MPVIDLGDGIKAFVCTKGRRDRCRFCHNQYVTKLCDFPTGRGRTCDAGMCDRCATAVAHEVDYCPRHKHERPAAQQTALALEEKS